MGMAGDGLMKYLLRMRDQVGILYNYLSSGSSMLITFIINLCLSVPLVCFGVGMDLVYYPPLEIFARVHEKFILAVPIKPCIYMYMPLV